MTYSPQQNTIFIYGGWTDRGIIDDTWAYSVQFNNWTRLAGTSGLTVPANVATFNSFNASDNPGSIGEHSFDRVPGTTDIIAMFGGRDKAVLTKTTVIILISLI